MRRMEQLLRDPEIKPGIEQITEALGASSGAYLSFVEGLKHHDVSLEWRYYTDGKAWLGKGLYRWTGIRGGQKEITVFWLSIWEGCFRVTFFISEKLRAEARKLPLTDETREMIEAAKQMGKLKFFPLVLEVRSEELFRDLYTLIPFGKTKK